MERRPTLLGVDLGTSSVKVLATTFEGKTVALTQAGYPLLTPQPDYVEQDVDVVYRAVMEAMRDAIGQVHLRGNEIAAIGFSSAMHGIAPVDAQGEALGPLITWMDRRSAPVADAWHADGTAARLYAQTGAPVHPMLPSCKLRWLADHDATLMARTARFVSMKELVVFRWTGEWLIDYGMASGTGLFDVRSRSWSPIALDAARIDAAKLSRIAPTSTTLEALRPGVAASLALVEKPKLVLASSDGALANLGVGAVGAGELALTLGTSGAIRTVVDVPMLDASGRTFCYAFDDARFIVGGPTSSGGAVLNAIEALFAPEVPVADRFPFAVAQAESAEPGANGLTFLPFLSGERAPYWMANLRGSIEGMDLSHTRADVFRAAFEGVVMALATVYDVVRETVGKPTGVRLSGGLTHASLVRQLIADVFDARAVLADQEEASAFGAAAMAGIAVHAIANDAAVSAMLEPVHVHEPSPVAVERYQRIFALYRRRVAAALPLYATSIEE